jgi:YidC/Oxa1 family membrane protein insertase
VDLVHQHADFLGINLLCNASQAGSTVKLDPKSLENVADLRGQSLDCGKGIPIRVPYYFLAILMVGTTYIQQRQMQRASPGGSQQQQALTRIMPLLFGVWGFIFPAGLVIYWTTTNAVQILQQRYTLSKQAQIAGPGPGASAARKPLPSTGDGERKATDVRKPGASGAARGGRGAQDGAARPRPSGGRAPAQPARGGRNARDRKKRRKR